MSRSDIIDLRSDTVTPDQGMRDAMASAPVGDDVFDDDRTVQSLEARVADLLGKGLGYFSPLAHKVIYAGCLPIVAAGRKF